MRLNWDTAGESRVWVRAGAIEGNSTVITAAWGNSTKTTHRLCI